VQQLGTSAQTHSSQAQPLQPAASLLAQPVHGVPQVSQAVVQASSQATSQQNGLASQTHSSQPQPAQPGSSRAPHPVGHAPQSEGQLSQVSPSDSLHVPSPQGVQLPHASHAATHSVVQASVQQAGFASQTHCSQAQPSHPGKALSVQPSEQAPQSSGQVAQVSPFAVWQLPLPHWAGQMSVPLPHAPSLQYSSMVHSSSSLQGPMRGEWTHPCAKSHESFVQAFWSLQSTSTPPRQNPPEHCCSV
jgi:hypothetical protein